MSDCCKVCDALQIVIDKCDVEMKKLECGTTTMPESMPPQNIDFWNDLLEERYEYITEFRSRLHFILRNDKRNDMLV